MVFLNRRRSYFLAELLRNVCVAIRLCTIRALKSIFRNIDLFGTNPISVANRAAADPATTVAVVGLRHQSVMSERRAADSQNANAPNE